MLWLNVTASRRHSHTHTQRQTLTQQLRTLTHTHPHTHTHAAACKSHALRIRNVVQRVRFSFSIFSFSLKVLLLRFLVFLLLSFRNWMPSALENNIKMSYEMIVSIQRYLSICLWSVSQLMLSNLLMSAVFGKYFAIFAANLKSFRLIILIFPLFPPSKTFKHTRVACLCVCECICVCVRVCVWLPLKNGVWDQCTVPIPKRKTNMLCNTPYSTPDTMFQTIRVSTILI